jgi:hypothetical protein
MSNTTIPQIGDTKKGHVFTENGWTPTKPPKKKRGGFKTFLILVAAGITVLIIVIVALMALIGSAMNQVEQDAKANAISKTEFQSIDLGDRINDVRDEFGEPSSKQITHAAGTKTVFLYYPVDNDQLLDEYQLTFENGHLTGKADY